MRSGRNPLALLSIATIVALGTSHALSLRPALGQSQARPPLGSQAPDTVGLFFILSDSTASEEQRQRAASQLVLLADTPSVREQLESIVSAPVFGVGGSRYVLAAASSNPGISQALYPAIARRILESPEWELTVALPALANFRTREAVEMLLQFTTHIDPAVQATAFRTLASLTGRDDLPSTPFSWARWFEGVRVLPEPLWRQELIERLATRAERLAVERTQAITRLTESLRQLYLASPVQTRTELLASWLKDDATDVRDLGFELARRELSGNGQLPQSVGDAAIDLIGHPDPNVRSKASVLVRQLAPAGASERVSAALSSESSPLVAADLLVAASRWPQIESVEPSLRWLAQPGPAFDAAAESCCLLARAGKMNLSQRQRCLALARQGLTSSPSPSLICLLWTLGDEQDLTLIEPLLQSPSATLRSAAARALMWDPAGAERIVEVAARFPDLFELATRAIQVHGPNAANFLRVAALQATSIEEWRSNLLRVAPGLEASELLKVAQNIQDPELSRSILAVITLPEKIASEASNPESRSAIAEAVLLQSQAFLDAGQPDLALSVLEVLPDIELVAPTDRLIRCRTIGLLALGRLELAELQADGSIEDWMEGLAAASAKPHQADVALRIQTKFAAALSPEQRAKVDAALSSRTASAPERDDPKIEKSVPPKFP